MTDENMGVPDPPEQPPPPPPPSTPAQSATGGMSGAAGQMFSTGEGMVTFGCYIIIAIYLVTGLLMNEYWIAWIALVPAITVVVLAQRGSSTAERFAPIPVIIKALGLLIALLAVLDFIEDIRFASSSFDEAWDIIGSLAFWAGAALCFLGARQIET